MTCAGPACAIASGSAGWRWLMWSFDATYLASVSAPGLYSTTDSAAASEPVPVTLLPIWKPIWLSLAAVSRARFGIVVPFTTVTVTLVGSTVGAAFTFSSFFGGDDFEPGSAGVPAGWLALEPPLSSLPASSDIAN